MYAQVHSGFSLRYGILSPVQVLEQAREAGVDCVALTDINSTAAVLDFVRLAPSYGVRPLAGVDIRVRNRPHYLILACNNEGYAELCGHLTAILQGTLQPEYRAPEFRHAVVFYSLQTWNGHKLSEHEYLGIQIQDLSRWRLIARRVPPGKAMALQPMTFRDRSDWNAHRLLRSIDHNCLLSKLPPDDPAPEHHRWMPLDRFTEAYREFPELIYRARCLTDRCRIHFEFGQQYPHKNQQTYTGQEELDFRLLHRLCRKNLPLFYPEPTGQVLNRLEKELEIIRQKRYVSYFLINWKILKYARSCGFFYVGRGSGANSLVAYLLRITQVDPIELDLYFERFINLYRRNPPDFDIDFSWKDRDLIIAYIFRRFPHVALLGTYVTFQYRALVRELAKVFGLPPHETEALARGRTVAGGGDRTIRLVLQYAARLNGLPNYLGIHAGGILITQIPIQHFSATFLPPKGFPTTQFDMNIAEDAGLHKFDVLSQRGLAKITDALSLIAQNRPGEAPIDLYQTAVFKNDEATRRLVREARTIGCFYVESPAMRMLMCKLQVQDYLGLVAASSVIRPGVARSGMMQTYILRCRFPARRREAPPVLLDIMPETHGVMVYQEDVIRVAHCFAGLTLAEADVLRRGMSGKFRSRDELERVKTRFFEGSHARGHSPELGREVWRQIESFAGYAFAKGHAASYVVESYQSLYLKAHYPLEYMVATLRNGGGFYSTEHYLHEAMRLGARVSAPCVQHSEAEVGLCGREIRLGLLMIRGINEDFVARLLAERRRAGVFSGLPDFCHRLSPPREQLVLLVRIGAFRFTGQSKKALMWEAHLHTMDKTAAPSGVLFREDAPATPDLPHLEEAPHEAAFEEYELLGFPLDSPFNLLLGTPPRGILSAELKAHRGRVVTVTAYLVSIKDTRTVKGELMQFGTFIDQRGDYLDTVHFPPVAARYPFRGPGVYQLQGRVSEELGFYSLEVQRMELWPRIPDPRFAEPPRPDASTPRRPPGSTPVTKPPGSTPVTKPPGSTPVTKPPGSRPAAATTSIQTS